MCVSEQRGAQHALQQEGAPAGPGASFLLLHPACGSDAPPPVLPLLTAALRSHVDAAATAAGHAPRALLPPPPPPAAKQAAAQRLTPFHSATVPSIEVESYVERLFKYTKCSPVCLVMAFAYMRRLAAADPLLRPCHLNVHRLLITGTMVACKFTDDRYFTNNYYAQVGGVSLRELNALELHLLKLLGFRAHVDVPELTACLQHIQGAAAGGAAWVVRQQSGAAGTPTAAQQAGGPQPPPTSGRAEQGQSPLTAAAAAPQPCSIRSGRGQLGLGLGVSPPRMAPPEWPRGPLQVASAHPADPAAATAGHAEVAAGASGGEAAATGCEVQGRHALAAKGCHQERAEAAVVEGVAVQAA